MTWLLALFVLFSPLHVPDMTHRWPMLPVARAAAQITHGQEKPAEEGVYCTPQGMILHGLQTPDQPCKCHIVMRADPDGCCEILQANDAKCEKFCHEDKCRCVHECVKSDAP